MDLCVWTDLLDKSFQSHGTKWWTCAALFEKMGGTGIYAGLGNKVRELEIHKQRVILLQYQSAFCVFNCVLFIHSKNEPVLTYEVKSGDTNYFVWWRRSWFSVIEGVKTNQLNIV